MKAVWNSAPITVRAVQEAIRPNRNLAYTTVMTIMDRLYHKGFLSRTLHSRTHYYEPAVDYITARDEALQSLIRSFFGSKEELLDFLNAEQVPMHTRSNGESASTTALDETLL